MKLTKILLLAITSALPLFAEQPINLRYSNGGSVGKETIENLSCSGVLKLNGTTIKTLSISGSLVTTSALLGALTVRGEANLRGSKISAPCTIYGYLRAQDTTFEDHLTLGAHKAVFTASHLSSITVQIEEGFKAKQIIELKQGTTVSGPIHFESGKGEVHAYNSKVTGPITGGKLIKK
jgi:hypothetical protein